MCWNISNFMSKYHEWNCWYMCIFNKSDEIFSVLTEYKVFFQFRRLWKTVCSKNIIFPGHFLLTLLDSAGLMADLGHHWRLKHVSLKVSPKTFSFMVTFVSILFSDDDVFEDSLELRPLTRNELKTVVLKIMNGVSVPTQPRSKSSAKRPKTKSPGPETKTKSPGPEIKIIQS